MQSGLMEQKLSNNRDEGQLRDTRFQKQFCLVVSNSKFCLKPPIISDILINSEASLK